MTVKENYWRYSQIGLIIIIGAILLKEFGFFLGGFLGAFTVYILVRNQMHSLTEKKNLKKSIAAVLILLEVIVCFLIPINVIIVLIIKVLDNAVMNSDSILSSFNQFIVVLQEKIGIDIFSRDSLIYISSYATKIGKILVGEISSFFINAFVLLFVLYFMLVSSRKMEKYIYGLIPFNDENKKHMTTRVKEMIVSNAIGIPLLAVIQGITATVGYAFFNAPLPLLLGLLTCFATIIPLVGTALVWVPLTIYVAVTGDWINAIGIGLFGLIIISNIDNLFRLLLQKKMADTHPLITVFGVIVGLSLFGFWGIIFGPVLISIFLILVDIFKREYLDEKDSPTPS